MTATVCVRKKRGKGGRMVCAKYKTTGRKMEQGHRRTKHTHAGWVADQRGKSKQKWEVAYRKSKR